MTMLLYVDQITRRFGRTTALQGLHFHMARGDVLGLLGPNGAGKTTALRILSGNLAPSSGRVEINGHDLNRSPRTAKARIGYLSERPPIYPEMRVDDFLAFAGQLRGLPRAEISAALSRVKEQCGLTHVARRLVGRLSKGYRQRVGIAQALVHRPDLIILDEPGDGLDPLQSREMQGLIRTMAEDAGVILSSHALPEIQATCSRAIILHQGQQLLDADLGQASRSTPELYVRLRPPPALKSLRGLSTVAAAEPDVCGGVRLCLHHNATADMLARQLVEHGYGLLELRPRRTDLEQVFFSSIGMERTP
jgi:ABC-2 type transport system ATP-binding protein